PLPVAVEFLQASRYLPRLLQVRAGKQVDHIACILHAACRVEARREAESHVPCRDVAAVEPGDLEQRLQAGLRRLPQSLQPKARDDTILSDQGNHISNGPDRHDLQVRLEETTGK